MKDTLTTVVALVLAFLVYGLLPKDKIFKKLDEILPF